MPSAINHRITPHQDTDFDKIVKWIISLSCPTLIVRENTNKFGGEVRPHLHVYIEFSKTKSTYCQKFSLSPTAPFKHYKGNSDHSTQECKDKQRNFQYLCKGWKGEDNILRPPIVLYNNILNEKNIEENQQLYWKEYNAKIESHKRPNKTNDEDLKTPKKKKLTWTEETIEAIQKLFAERNEEVHLKNPIHKQLIYLEMMKRLGKAAKTFDEMIFMRLMNAVENGLAPGQKQAIFYDQLQAKYPIEFMAHIDYARFIPESPIIDLSGIKPKVKGKMKTPLST